MSRKLGSVISAAITLMVFTVLPFYAPSLLPPEVGQALSQAGFNQSGFINQIAIMGVLMAILTLVKGFSPESSPICLLASIASSVSMLVFTLLSLGLGDWEGLGITTISLNVQGVLNTVVLDLRLFVQLAVLSVALQVMHSILVFVDARKRTSSPNNAGRTREALWQMERDKESTTHPVAQPRLMMPPRPTESGRT